MTRQSRMGLDWLSKVMTRLSGDRMSKSRVDPSAKPAQKRPRCEGPNVSRVRVASVPVGKSDFRNSCAASHSRMYLNKKLYETKM